jgi:hypothetical protein
MPNTRVAVVVDERTFMPTIEMLASEAGVKIQRKDSIRFPVDYLSEVMRAVERYGLVGRISIDYSQGQPGAVTWESTR